MEETEFSNSSLPETNLKMEVFVEPLILQDKKGAETATAMSSSDPEVVEQCELGDENVRIKPFICPVCCKGFGTNSRLKRHVKIHDRIKRFKFSVTRMGTLNTSDFHRDTSLATAGSNLKSIICKSSIDKSISIDVDVCSKLPDECLFEVESSDIAVDPLDTCLGGDTFDGSSEPSERRSHLKNNVNTCYSETTQDEKNFRCHFCRKTFLRKQHLKRHLQLHQVSELHDCDKCGKCFSQISYLRNHIKTVHGRVKKLEKMIKCTNCDKSFGRMSHLKRHMKLHLGGQTFHCEICGNGFQQKGSLKVHVQRVHSREKAFEKRCRKDKYKNNNGVFVQNSDKETNKQLGIDGVMFRLKPEAVDIMKEEVEFDELSLHDDDTAVECT